MIIPLRFSYALWRSQFTLLFGKVRKSEMRGSPQEISLVLYLHFNHKTDLTFSIKTFTIKVRSLCVVLMISPLVVRRTFLFNCQWSWFSLKIRLLFSITIQLSVVDYIIQLIVVNVNDFLQNFKIIFWGHIWNSAERLKTLRKQVKLTQAQIAEKLNISQQAYASWGARSKNQPKDNLVKIAQILNVSVDYLIGNSEEKSDELDNIELLFRKNSKGLTDEEKEIFKKNWLNLWKNGRKRLVREINFLRK